MGILDRLFTRASSGGSFQVSEQPPGWIKSYSGWTTATGLPVSPNSALGVIAVFACVRVLAETLASFPLFMYRTTAQGKEKAPGHYLYNLLHDAPNGEMTSFDWRETMMGHLTTWGNAYSEIEIANNGQVRGLWPLRPDQMQVKREAGRLRYHYRLPNGQGVILPSDRVFHLHGLGFNGITGYSPIQLARQGIGLAMAAEQYGARFFGNDARPSVILKYPGELTDTAHANIQESWIEAHGGLDQSHRVAILEDGLDFDTVGIPNEDAQFLETRQFQVTEIARLFRVPPHMIADLERATFSNIEHQSIDFVTYTMRPWLVRWEQAIGLHLLLPRERGEFFAGFLIDALLRGDTKTRYEAYSQARQWGWLSANDIRRLENQNPIGPAGDIYLVPMNMIAADQVLGQGVNLARAAMLPERRAAVAASARHSVTLRYVSLMAEAMARILRREANDIGGAIAKYNRRRSVGEFSIWLEQFYRDHAGFVAEQIRGVSFSLAEAVADLANQEIGLEGGDPDPGLIRFVQAWIEAYASRHTIANEAALRVLLESALEAGENWAEILAAELETWRDGPADSQAQNETFRLSNAAAKTAFGLAGILILRWAAIGESCPYCTALDGVQVGIHEVFIGAGQEFQPAGADRPLTPRRNVGHGPAHDGCDCIIMAGR